MASHNEQRKIGNGESGGQEKEEIGASKISLPNKNNTQGKQS
jgi:hypothetical protein